MSGETNVDGGELIIFIFFFVVVDFGYITEEMRGGNKSE
jgi:hypothetical protein